MHGLTDEDRACMEGTRVALLRRITGWRDESDFDPKHVFWLCGLAGSGKSKISGSVELQAKLDGLLGACFYFVREQSIRNKRVILELVRQVARWQNGALRKIIAAAIKADPDVIHSSLSAQYNALLVKPLSSLE